MASFCICDCSARLTFFNFGTEFSLSMSYNFRCVESPLLLSISSPVSPTIMVFLPLIGLTWTLSLNLLPDMLALNGLFWELASSRSIMLALLFLKISSVWLLFKLTYELPTTAY